MKRRLYLMICLLPLISGTCKKESPSCHHNIVIKNNSRDPVLYAERSITGVSSIKCLLQGFSIMPKEDIKYDLKYCWEDALSKGKTFELYIVDPEQYNKNEFYDCDSIEIKNKVLKHYVLTLDDLKRNDFTITYE